MFVVVTFGAEIKYGTKHNRNKTVRSFSRLANHKKRKEKKRKIAGTRMKDLLYKA